MANAYGYISFEPDQVLTDKDLNDTFSYLDQQTRWTRNKLIGIGIVCGFDIIHQPGVIQITKGCGVTSQGYLVLQDAMNYSYYTQYIAPDQPTNPALFEYPDNNMPFFKNFCQNKNVFELLTDDDYKDLDTDEQQNAPLISAAPANFLANYAVVLFLEATETDLKNCDMFDCNNNGEKVSFNIRALLVAKKDLPNNAPASPPDRIAITNAAANIPHEIYLKRFNVPYTEITKSTDIINAFAKLVDDFTLTRVANAYIVSYEKYQLVLNETANPFTNLFTQLQKTRDNIINNNSLFIQYFYDYIDDLIKAYYEFTVKVSGIITMCCPDENLFPLHLVLGDASLDTNGYTTDQYRQYFIHSPLFTQDNGEISEAVFLFDKMKSLTQHFTVLTKDTFANATIRVTPSQYQHLWLSQRAIPYYYNANEAGKELYKLWSYYRTTHNSAIYNLGYNASLYNSNDAVVNPLLYDIEFYNFFRIEGHIGKNFTSVLSILTSQIKTFNLPFDIVAIQAGGDTSSVNEALPQCSFQDLNSLFYVLRSDLYCLLGKLMCYIGSQTYNPPNIIITFPNLPIHLENTVVKNEALETEAKTTAFEKASTHSGFTSSAAKTTTSAAFTSSSSFLFNFIYFKGTFLKQQNCFSSLAANSVGKYYSQHVPTGAYFFSGFDATNLSNNFLSIVDLIEEVISTVYTASPSSIDVNTFSSKMSALQNYLLQLNNVFLQFEENQKKDNFFADFEENIDLFDEVINNCFAAKFSSLKNEYTLRVNNIKQQMLFTNYYNKHRGLEHKAGVPKGGTFVIVYNAPAATQTTGTTSSTVASTANTGLFKASGTTAKMNFSHAELFQRLQSSFSDVAAINPEFINQAISALSPTLSAAAAATPAFGDNIVIADFYLPYLCSSDCSPITYVLPKQDDVTFSIQPNKFLFNDTNNYPFTTNANIAPTDFNSTSNPGNLNLLVENNKLELHPEMNIPATLITTLTYKNLTVNITIVRPDASFIINVQAAPTGAPMIGPAAKNIDGTSYQWLVNGQQSAFENKAIPAAIPLGSIVQNAGEFTLELVISYTINEVTSTDDKKAVINLDMIKKALADGKPITPFDTSAAPAAKQPSAGKDSPAKKIKRSNKK